MTLTAEQYTWLTQGIHPNRVRQLKGQSHLEAWDVRRTLIRIFGFGGFQIETKTLDMVRELEYPPGSIKYRNKDGSERTNDRTAWTVIYRAEIRLTIRVGGEVFAVFEDGAAGDSQNQPVLGDAHDHAMKTALSQALKRCAVNLGDQFGLSLYNGGNQAPVVLRSLVVPEGVQAPNVAQPPAEEAPVQPEPQPQAAAEEAAHAEPAEPTAEQVQAFIDLARHIAAAESENRLRELYLQAAEEFKADRLTAGQGNELRSAIEERVAEIQAEQADTPQVSNPVGPSEHQHRKMHALWREVGLGGTDNRENRLTQTSLIVGRDIGSSAKLTPEEADRVIAALDQQFKQKQHNGAEVPV